MSEQIDPGTLGWRGEVRRGALATLPLWPGGIPFGIAFGALARTAGFSVVETVAISLLVFAGGAQVVMVTLFAAGAGSLPILLTVLVLNLRHALYGLSLGARLGRLPGRARAFLAHFLTDEAYGLTIRDSLAGGTGVGFYVGASLAIYGIFNVATLIGALVGGVIPDPARLGLGFIFTLTFLTLLQPLLRGWNQGLVAIVAAIAVLLLRQVVPGGVAILGAALLAAGLGAVVEGRRTAAWDR